MVVVPLIATGGAARGDGPGVRQSVKARSQATRRALDIAEILKRLKAIDDAIDKGIKSGTRGDYRGARIAIVEARKLKESLIFNVGLDIDVLGVTFYNVYDELYCIDSSLDDFGQSTKATALDAARKCALRLYDRVHKANPSPSQDAQAALDQIIVILQHLGDTSNYLKQGKPDAAKLEARHAEDAKWYLVDQILVHQTIFGVNFFYWFRYLSNTDICLDRAQSATNSGIPVKTDVVGFLERAKSYKQDLEKDLQQARQLSCVTRPSSTPDGKQIGLAVECSSPARFLQVTGPPGDIVQAGSMPEGWTAAAGSGSIVFRTTGAPAQSARRPSSP